MRNDSFYPIDFDEIAELVKSANGYCCMACGIKCRRPGEAYDGHKRTLTCAHITQDYAAPVVQLASLCVICHFRYDSRHSWIARLRWMRFRQAAAGQLHLVLR